ncbi:MAG TPA: MBL fold metallo-hydrolase [Solirubrobacteraceae bacterium]|nr:MBL fold metallo-hydrolase [Solirubrobacteraceae bacterium]
MRAIDLLHLGREKVICCWMAGGVLIDPGPESCVDTLLAALGDERPSAILLTHIHFDHAGATGALVRRWPGLPVHVHERGARHLADPERLVASATRLYGEENMKRLWGEVSPVPEENLRVLTGGERGVEGAFRVEYTPGHASHHVSFLHEDSGWAFVGDVAGVRIPPSELVVAPTPPPDIDVAAWERSLDLVAGWSPERLALTHWGEVEDPAEQLEACRRALREEAELAGEQDLDGFMATLHERIAADAPELIETYEQAAPLDHLFLGLDRWHSKQAA